MRLGYNYDLTSWLWLDLWTPFSSCEVIRIVCEVQILQTGTCSGKAKQLSRGFPLTILCIDSLWGNQKCVPCITKASSYLPRGFSLSVFRHYWWFRLWLSYLDWVCVLSSMHTMANYLRTHMIVHSWMSTKHVYLCCPSINILETAFIGVDLQLSVTETIS